MGKDNYMAKYVAARYLRLKIQAIEYKGGKCKCGYNKCHNALQFHHRDPTNKDSDWRYLRKRSWDFIKTELDKCDLLCANCHAEVHHDDDKLKETLEWLNDRKRKPANYKNGNCENCGKQFNRNRNNRKSKYCGVKCSGKAQEKADYPNDLEFIKMVDDLGQSAVGRNLGVSANSIKKRYRKIKCQP